MAAVVRGAASGAVAAVRTRLRLGNSDYDPIALLQVDHDRFRAWLKQGEAMTERARSGRRDLLNTLTAALIVHEALEEQILYPALKPHPEARDLVLEGFQEHHVSDVIVRELHDVAPDDEMWGAKFKVLKESLEHHLKEEESLMFRIARGLFERDEFEQLGAEMRALKSQLER